VVCSAVIPGDTIASGTVFGDYTLRGAVTAFEGPTGAAEFVIPGAVRTGQTNVAPLQIYTIVQGYSLVPNSPAYSFDVSLGASEASFGNTPSRGLVEFRAWYSSTNSAVIPPNGIASNNASCTPIMSPGSNSCQNDPGPVIITPGLTGFSIITRTTFWIGLGDTSIYAASPDVNLTLVPEPGSMVLFGTGLLGLAGLVRRKLKK